MFPIKGLKSSRRSAGRPSISPE